jgi:crooked neck
MSERSQHLSMAKVKNKQPAAIQITAEQILREAQERQETALKPIKQRIMDEEELKDFLLNKRKTFEDAIRRNRSLIGAWIKYAQFEESQGQLDRAESVYERALDVDARNITLWMKYAEMEIKHKRINHARNLLDRAVTLLPRMDQLWYKYAYMEEMLGNIMRAREIFERWVLWKPDIQVWNSYINFEKRYQETDRTRALFERYIVAHPSTKTWLKFARFEEDLKQIARARLVYEQAITAMGKDYADEELFSMFAKFETRYKEFERANAVYQYGLSTLPKSKAQKLMDLYTQFQRQHGTIEDLEEVLVNKRRHQYEEALKQNILDYDIWFDYIRLEEMYGKDGDSNDPSNHHDNSHRVREVYERAIAQKPPALEKRLWKRYIYLWLYYAIFEELEAKDTERTRSVYKQCLALLPHKQWTFAKVWLWYAQFEIRQKNMAAARKILGTAIGLCSKNRLFKGYIELELQLFEFDRCRRLYEKYLENYPSNVYAWIKYAELETYLNETDRARAIFELAIEQPTLDMPELLWKAYIGKSIFFFL